MWLVTESSGRGRHRHRSTPGNDLHSLASVSALNDGLPLKQCHIGYIEQREDNDVSTLAL